MKENGFVEMGVHNFFVSRKSIQRINEFKTMFIYFSLFYFLFIQELANEVKSEPGKVYPLKADLTNEQDIVNAFDWVEKTLKKPVHVLVNNAGVSVLRNTIGKIKLSKRKY